MMRFLLTASCLMLLTLFSIPLPLQAQWEMGVKNRFIDQSNTQVYLSYEAVSDAQKRFRVVINIWPEDRSRVFLRKELQLSTQTSRIFRQGFSLPSGRYQVDVEIEDPDLQRFHLLTLPEPYFLNETTNLLLSDIYLSYAANPADAFVEPVLAINLAAKDSNLSYFLEIYSKRPRTISVQAILYQENPTQFQASTAAYTSLHQSTRQLNLAENNSVVFADSLNLNSLEGGEYMIHILVYEDGYLLGEEKSWFVLGGDIQERIQNNLEESIRMMAYILPDSTVSKLLAQEPSDVQRNEFEVAWKRLYPQDTEFHQEAYYERVFEANQRYPEGGVPGWQSERGRVFIQYGEAREKEIAIDGTSYVRWTYAKWSLSFLFEKQTDQFLLVK